MVGDLLLERSQGRTRVESGLVDERAPELGAGGHRVGRTPFGRQSPHEQEDTALAQRLGRDHRGRLGHRRGVPARDQRLRQVVAQPQPELVEAGGLALQETDVAELLERLTSPQVERLARESRDLVRGRALELRGQLTRTLRVEVLAVQVEGVPTARTTQPVRGRSEVSTQPRDVVVDRLDRVRRRLVRPQGVDQPLGTDHSPTRQRQGREHGAPSTAGYVDRRPCDAQHEGAEDVHLHRHARCGFAHSGLLVRGRTRVVTVPQVRVGRHRRLDQYVPGAPCHLPVTRPRAPVARDRAARAPGRTVVRQRPSGCFPYERKPHVHRHHHL